MAKVTKEDRTSFKKLDRTVRQSLKAGIQAGVAFREIRDRHLWRAGDYASWDAYCQQVAGYSKRHTNRLIQAAEITEELAEAGPNGPADEPVIPCSEAQVRPLAKLEKPETRRQAWHQAIETARGQPTAEIVTKVVSALLAEPADPSVPDSEEEEEENTDDFDTGIINEPSADEVDAIMRLPVERLLFKTFHLKQALQRGCIPDDAITLVLALENLARQATPSPTHSQPLVKTA